MHSESGGMVAELAKFAPGFSPGNFVREQIIGLATVMLSASGEVAEAAKVALRSHETLPAAIHVLLEADCALQAQKDMLKKADNGFVPSIVELGNALVKFDDAERKAPRLIALHKQTGASVNGRQRVAEMLEAALAALSATLDEMEAATKAFADTFGNISDAVREWSFDKTPWIYQAHTDAQHAAIKKVETLNSRRQMTRSLLERVATMDIPRKHKEVVKVAMDKLVKLTPGIEQAVSAIGQMMMASLLLNSESQDKTRELKATQD